MPHLTLHYSGNLSLDSDALLAALNDTLIASGHFDEESIKSRALPLDHFRVGSAPPSSPRAFVHAQLRILPGRPEPVRALLAEALLQTLADHLRADVLSVQLCTEVEELPASYRKTILLPPARFLHD